MKKIEKERRKNEYNIQSINNHLINILEEDYNIELGNVDLVVLDKLFNGHPIALSEIFYLDITASGIGKITEEGHEDINFQMEYLYSLHQKHSTSKFILTCGTVRFINEKKVENYEIALTSDTELYKKFFKGCLDAGVYLAPSAFEICFMSSAHTDSDLERAAEIMSKSIENL